MLLIHRDLLAAGFFFVCVWACVCLSMHIYRLKQSHKLLWKAATYEYKFIIFLTDITCAV